MLTVIYSCRLNFLVAINFIKIESYLFISEKSTYIILGILSLLPFLFLAEYLFLEILLALIKLFLYLFE